MDSALRGEAARSSGSRVVAVAWRRVVVPVAALMIVGTLLRVVGIGTKAYWQDEIGTIGALDNLSSIASSQATPPFYYLLAWPWAHVFGTTEIGLRSLSTVFSVALIPVAYLAGRQLLSHRVGLIAAALVATNPLLVWFGQEAKSYALLSLLTGLSFLLFLRALDRPTTGRLLAWGGCCGLAVATHYFAVFFVAVEAAVLVWRFRRNAVAVGAAAIPIVTGLALWPLLHAQGTPAWVNEMGLAGRVIQTPAIFIVGFEAPAPYAVTGIAAVICIGGLWLLLARSTPAGRRRGLLAVAIGAASLVGALIVGAQYFLYRNVIASVLPILLALACGFGASRARRLGVSLAAALCLLSVGIVLATAHTPKFGKEDWRNAAGAIGDPRERAIVVTPNGGAPSLTHYLDGHATYFTGSGVRVAEIAVVAGAVRPPNQVAEARPPSVATPPAPAGFELVGRRNARYYTVITYGAPARRFVSSKALLALALGRDHTPALLVEQP